jgi:hypothetical protein
VDGCLKATDGPYALFKACIAASLALDRSGQQPFDQPALHKGEDDQHGRMASTAGCYDMLGPSWLSKRL